MFGFGKQKIHDDPCIIQIVQFVKAVSEIKQKDGGSSWIDFYSVPLDVEIVCRYFEFGDCSIAGLVYDYTHNSYPNGDKMLEPFTNQFNSMINISNFPQGTQLEIKNKDGAFELTYAVVPMYRNHINKYRVVVYEAIKNAGLPFMDKDDKGVINPHRINIEQTVHSCKM